MPGRGGAFGRLYRGETSFDFAGRWRRWFMMSGAVILIGLISLGVRGLNFSIEFKGGTIWEVPSSQSVGTARSAVEKVNPALSQATIEVLTDRQTGKRIIEVQAAAKATTNEHEIHEVSDALAKMAGVSSDAVQINAIGPSWGSSITGAAVKAVIIFLVAVTLYIWFRFEGKMAVAALTALVHDIVVTVGIYSLSGFQVSPDTVIAFLTILGYSLYDTIVVFDKVQENTRGVASTNRLTYSETVNISMNQVLARSLNTSFVAIIPILSILVIGAGLLGATALNDFGLALLIGLTTGAYSSIFIASPLLALLKEREPRYAEIRRRRGSAASRPLTPAEAARGRAAAAGLARPAVTAAAAPARGPERDLLDGGFTGEEALSAQAAGRGTAGAALGAAGGAGTPVPRPLAAPIPPRSANRPPPRPRKKKGRH